MHIPKIVLLCASLCSQAQSVDSLKRRLNAIELTSVERSIVLENLAKHYARTNADSALYYVEDALRLADKNNDEAATARALIAKASIVLLNKKEIENTAVLLDEVQKILNKDSSKFISIYPSYYLNRGSLQLHTQKFDSALKSFINGLSYVDNKIDPSMALKFFNNIAIIHMQLKQPEQAAPYLEKAVALHKKNDLLRVSLLSNLGAMYHETDSYDLALINFKESEKILSKLNHPNFLSKLCTSLSALLQDMNKVDSSLVYARRSLKIKQQYNLPGQGLAFNNLGYSHFLLKNYDSAIHYYEKAIPLTEGNYKLQLLLNLKNAYSAIGNSNEALDYLEEYNNLKDSIDSKNYEAKVTEIEERYQARQKEETIQLLSTENELQKNQLKQQQLLLTGVVLLVVLLAIIGYLIFRQNRIQQALTYVKMRQQFLRIQLNPHFLFNALNSIQYYLYKNDPDESIGYLSSFSTLMRDILETSDQEWISIKKECDMLENYLKLQQLIYPGAFNFLIDMDKALQEQDALIPTMVTQPFIENAVVHGMKDRKGGNISIHFSDIGESILIDIEDDGNGIAPEESNSQQKLHRSMSSSIIQERFNFLRKSTKHQIELQIASAKPDATFSGTRVKISLPKMHSIDFH